MKVAVTTGLALALLFGLSVPAGAAETTTVQTAAEAQLTLREMGAIAFFLLLTVIAFVCGRIKS